jgi:hypothetical protein
MFANVTTGVSPVARDDEKPGLRVLALVRHNSAPPNQHMGRARSIGAFALAVIRAAERPLLPSAHLQL